MENFGDTATTLSKNPLGIIALFIVLVYGIAGLVLGASGESLLESHKTVLVWFLAIFPFSVLGSFTWLVSKHHTKLYSPSDFRNDEGFIRILSPEEQKRKIESEVKEIRENDSDITETNSTKPDHKNNNQLMQSILLAEELAFRELETLYNVSINRHVSIGTGYDTGMDGMFVSENQAYIIEIKYVRNRINILTFEKGLKALTQKLKKFNWKNFQIIFAIVIEDESLLTKEQTNDIFNKFSATGNQLGVRVTPKVFLLAELKEKFGYQSS
ncbi:hypothetical protein [Aeromonas hydrophila]|uniref:hypothetical protein n=1 Tax=Aeromonas hydrophila TaxID=644 RepID=UPI002B4719A3|nr:hypothetical protein [Aeromonas hydrophila]